MARPLWRINSINGRCCTDSPASETGRQRETAASCRVPMEFLTKRQINKQTSVNQILTSELTDLSEWWEISCVSSWNPLNFYSDWTAEPSSAEWHCSLLKLSVSAVTNFFASSCSQKSCKDEIDYHESAQRNKEGIPHKICANLRSSGSTLKQVEPVLVLVLFSALLRWFHCSCYFYISVSIIQYHSNIGRRLKALHE